MSDEPRENTFRYAFTAEEVAINLAKRLINTATILRAISAVYDDEAKQRGLMHFILSELSSAVDDASVRLTNFAAAEHPSDNGKVGDQ